MSSFQKIPRHERRATYYPALDAFCPGEPEAVRMTRAEMMLLRDEASSALRRVGPEAAEILEVIVRISSAHIYANAPLEVLLELRQQLTNLMWAARGMAKIFRSGGGDAHDG